MVYNLYVIIRIGQEDKYYYNITKSLWTSKMPKIQDMIDSLGKVIKRIPTEIYGEIQKDLKFWGKMD